MSISKSIIVIISIFLSWAFYAVWVRRPMITVNQVDFLKRTANGEAKAGKIVSSFSTSNLNNVGGNLYYIKSEWYSNSIFRISIYSQDGNYVVRQTDIDFDKKEVINKKPSGDPTSIFNILFKA